MYLNTHNNKKPYKIRLYFHIGGAEGSRTPVQKKIILSFYKFS